MILVKRLKRRKTIPIFMFTVLCVFSFALFVMHPTRVLSEIDNPNPDIKELTKSDTNQLFGRNLEETSDNFELFADNPIEILAEEVPVQEINHETIENFEGYVPPLDLGVEDTADTFYVKSVEENLLPTLEDNVVQEIGEENDQNAQNELQNFIQESVSKLFSVFTSTLQVKPITKEEAVSEQRDFILQKYSKEFDLSKYMVNEGGNPIRNIIFTTWRSGSTFLGEAITSHPAMFYHYEPLLHFEIQQVRSGPLAEEGLRVIYQLLQCNYTDLQDYVSYGKWHWNLHTHNFRLWKYCRQNRGLCEDSNFLSEMCQIFPFQIMKTVRMRLHLAESLLHDEKLDVRILFLVRDPRGTMQSRSHRNWCPSNPDCFDPKRLCSDMEDDYRAAIYLREKFPDKFMMVRYEDISMNPFSGVKKVLDFFRLSYHPTVDRFIKTHTVDTIGGVSSTFRDSKTTPFRWIQHFSVPNNTQELTHIQEQCSEAMTNWGYLPMDLNVNNTGFMPLLPPPWIEMVIPQDEEM